MSKVIVIKTNKNLKMFFIRIIRVNYIRLNSPYQQSNWLKKECFAAEQTSAFTERMTDKDNESAI